MPEKNCVIVIAMLITELNQRNYCVYLYIRIKYNATR